jgi:hypothetical protein
VLALALITLALSTALALSPHFFWHHCPHFAGVAALVVLALLSLLRWCCHCLGHGLLHCPWLVSTCQLNKSKDACKSTAGCTHNKGKDACVMRVLMPHHDKGNNTSAMAQTRQLNEGNNADAMMVMMPMRREGK